MSDGLIERITKCSASEKRDMEGNPDPEGYRSGMWITAEDADTILSALKTLRGEATAPKMAEVDALVKTFLMEKMYQHKDTFLAATEKLRTAILACEREKQRADEAEAMLEKSAGVQEVGMSCDLIQGASYWLITDWWPEWQVWEYIGNDYFGMGDNRVAGDDVREIRGPIPSPEQGAAK